jgi:hypothetical protein
MRRARRLESRIEKNRTEVVLHAEHVGFEPMMVVSHLWAETILPLDHAIATLTGSVEDRNNTAPKVS